MIQNGEIVFLQFNSRTDYGIVHEICHTGLSDACRQQHSFSRKFLSEREKSLIFLNKRDTLVKQTSVGQK